jgi:hypothetical protein
MDMKFKALFIASFKKLSGGIHRGPDAEYPVRQHRGRGG